MFNITKTRIDNSHSCREPSAHRVGVAAYKTPRLGPPGRDNSHESFVDCQCRQ